MAPSSDPDKPDTTIVVRAGFYQATGRIEYAQCANQLPLSTAITYQGIGWTRSPEQQAKHERRQKRDEQRRKCPWYNKHR